MRVNRWNVSTGIIEVSYPDIMTADDVQDFKDQMAVTFRMLDRAAAKRTAEVANTDQIAIQ
jgi:hypothetical protein